MSKKKGRLIVLEGPDGSGKATQTALLCEKLAAAGYSVRQITFPDYDSPAAAPVKMYLAGELGKNAGDVNPYAAATFFAVDRFFSYRQKWREALDSGTIIVADRYTTSNLAHQAVKIDDAAEREKFIRWLLDFEYEKLRLPRPDCVIFLDLPPEVSAQLMAQRGLNGNHGGDIHEKDAAYLKRCHAAYGAIAAKDGWETVNCCNYDSGRFTLKTTDKISGEIYKIVEKYI